MLRLMAVRTLASRSAASGAAASLGTLLLLFVINAVAGPGQCVQDLACRIDPSEPTGCAPAPPCDGPGPSWQTALVVALVVGIAVWFAVTLRERASRRG